MTNTNERVSLAAKRRSTVEGVLSLSAAKLALQVAGMLESAKESSGFTSRQLSSRMNVSEGRISQILNGDGNLRIATVGRFLRACGYELELSAIAKDDVSKTIRPVGRQRESVTQSWEIWEQTYIGISGVTKHRHVMRGPESNDPLIAVGHPDCVVSVHKTGTKFKVLRVAATADDVSTWSKRTSAAVDSELGRKVDSRA